MLGCEEGMLRDADVSGKEEESSFSVGRCRQRQEVAGRGAQEAGVGLPEGALDVGLVVAVDRAAVNLRGVDVEGGPAAAAERGSGAVHLHRIVRVLGGDVCGCGDLILDGERQIVVCTTASVSHENAVWGLNQRNYPGTAKVYISSQGDSYRSEDERRTGSWNGQRQANS